ncbi:hypothetical protein GDO81_018125 [Engystomops pustulosus]|uniref:Uncharacterized protein n=1 Tax=Engystomops pustulosus TaxID=76066 RepID=A0AAV7A5P0_ENGPU|nr:hypothetical protein GDO81_018125 [Engystomops pustulosus]
MNITVLLILNIGTKRNIKQVSQDHQQSPPMLCPPHNIRELRGHKKWSSDIKYHPLITHRHTILDQAIYTKHSIGNHTALF